MKEALKEYPYTWVNCLCQIFEINNAEDLRRAFRISDGLLRLKKESHQQGQRRARLTKAIFGLKGVQ